jgi:poly-gamma-glutamate synthesis protein (capsule biosynthesis protein)
MGAGCWYSANENTKKPSSSLEIHIAPILDRDENVTATFIDADRFAIPELDRVADRRLAEEDAFACASFRGGIVNHHALASDVLAGFFRTLGRCRPDIKRVIILSPDHTLGALAPAVTHRLDYRVEGKDILTDQAAIDRLLASVPFVREQPSLFEREHGIGALLPFLFDALPDAYIIPIVLPRSATAAERDSITSWISKELRDLHAFVLVSSDMSHYLDEYQAMQNDQQTKIALDTDDVGFFERVNDDFTDNGRSIAVAQQSISSPTWHLLHEGISSQYAGSPGFTTSYLVGFWE